MPEVYKAIQYGARPNNAADDWQKVQRAIDAAGVGGIFAFNARPGAVYTLSRALIVKSKQTILIPRGVTLQWQANSNGGDRCFFKVQDCEGVTFTGGGTLDGNRTAHTSIGAPTYAVANDSELQLTGIFILGGSDVTIDGLKFINMPMTVAGGDGSGINISTGTGGHTDYAENVTIQNCVFDGCTRNATQGGAVVGLKFENNVCRNANGTGGDGAGIQLEGEEGNTDAKFTDVLIAGNVFHDNKVGVSISNHSAAASNFTRIRIEANKIRDNGAGNGIYVSKTQNVDIVGNHVSGASEIGIYVLESRGTKVLDNHVHENVGSGITLHGCTHFECAGNESYRNGANGITVLPNWSGADRPCHAVITANHCFNNATVDATAAGIFIVPRDVNNVSAVKVFGNQLGNSSEYHATPTQKYGWTDRYPSTDNGYCSGGEYALNSYVGNVTANYSTHGTNKIADLQDGVGDWTP